jgi:alkanesulfonate monooxygenase SsuD/methylene tetrahydromethanopterin reductase-like flavin-dependent oxidoreductase (luciferase family)
MKLGHFSHIWRKPGMSPAARFAELWRELELCDSLGFDFGFAVEHHFDPRESLSASPPIYIASAAAHTQHMRIGAMGWIAGLYDPLRIVEEAIGLDQLSEGRLEVGLVSGFSPAFSAPFKADFAHSRERAIEAFELLRTACANPEGFSFDGPFHQYENLTLHMGPYQQPHPPVWLETRHPPTLEYLANAGIHTGYVHYLPREWIAPRYQKYLADWRAAGHAQDPNINYWTFVYVDETDDRAWEVAGPSWAYNYNHVSNAEGIAAGLARRGESEAAELMRHFADPQYMREHRIGLIGSPETVARQLREYAQEGCFNTLFGEFNFGALTTDQVLRSIQLFGEEVIPRVRDFSPY